MSSTRSCAIWTVAGALLLHLPTASAQPANPGTDAPVYFVLSAPDPAREAPLEPLARQWLAGHSVSAELLRPTVMTPLAASTERSQLEVLIRVESLLREGRELSARFDERLSLRRFSEAEQLLRDALEIPHVHAWLSEVNLELGLCAAQLGELELAETALGRAASLDPSRALQAAEAPPDLLALARGIEQRRLRAPLSQVSIEAAPVGATLWLDGQAIGQAPHEVSVASGVHVLRVAAPGHRTYATLLELGPGRRAPVSVVLAEDPLERARQALLRARSEPAAARSRSSELARLAEGAVWLFEAGEGPFLRALAYRCDPACVLAGTLGQGPPLAAREPSESVARAWLSADASAPGIASRGSPERPWWKRWPVWTAGVIVVVAAGVTAGLLAAPEPKVVSERELVLDPGRLPQ